MISSFRVLKKTHMMTVTAAIACLFGGVSVQAQSLTVNGQVASSGLKTINGRVYVPLSDIAKAFGQTVVKRPGGYTLTTAGGAGEVGDAHQGKIGQTLFTGQFRFMVTSITKVASYTTLHGKQMLVTPDSGNSLFVVNCRIKNGTPKKQNLVFSTNDTYGNPNTALVDDQDHSYAPINFHGGDFGGYDVHMDDSYPDGAYLNPGSAIDFAVVFNAPRDTKPKGLIFSILKYDERDHAKAKTVDVRVSFAQ